MPSYTIKVPNNDDGEDLGEYESDYLPRVGDQFTLWHPRVCQGKDHPFCAVVSAVTHEAVHKSHPFSRGEVRLVDVIVWLAEEGGAPSLYCVCTETERAQHGVDINGVCVNCDHPRWT